MLFTKNSLTPAEKASLDTEGHVLLPGRLTEQTHVSLIEALADIEVQAQSAGLAPRHYAAEHHAFLASLIGHPDMITLTQAALGPEIRFDHCVALNRAGGDSGISWHSHDYAEERPDLSLIRVFFYVTGFTQNDGGLKVVPGSHLFRDPKIAAKTDEELHTGWLAGKTHPLTGQPLKIEPLSAPENSVVLMHTHAAHAVTPRQKDSPMRWCVVYAYHNPGVPPTSERWITPDFRNTPPPGAEHLMPED
jgi:hypothetical protein